VKRIHAAYSLQVDDDVERDRIERAHSFHAAHCPVARSIRDAIEVSTSYDLVRA
jgi:uncharacterized OsmC-like protein